jgi:hypothetical protein
MAVRQLPVQFDDIVVVQLQFQLLELPHRHEGDNVHDL